MLNVNVISSGSRDGNCTQIKTSAGENFLLDVGTTFKTLQTAINYEFVDGALVTHEHTDHAKVKTLKTLLERGTDIFMTAGTQKALNLEERHNLHILKDSAKLGSCNVEIYPITHDAAEPVAFSLDDGDDKVFYITDTGKIDFPIIGATRLIVEANHSAESLAQSSVEEWRKTRIKNFHLSIDKLLATLEEINLTQCKEIHLIHISSCNGNGDEFAAMVKQVVKDIPVYAY